VAGFEVVEVEVVFVVCSDIAGLVSVSAIVGEGSRCGLKSLHNGLMRNEAQELKAGVGGAYARYSCPCDASQ
jgi:hypothetical protein